MRRLGLSPGERLAIFARTSLQWQLAEMAGLLAGAVVVGVDPHATADHAGHVLRHSGASCLVVDEREKADRIGSSLPTSVRFVVTLDDSSVESGHAEWRPWSSLQRPEGGPQGPAYPRVAEDDPATLIYTSGTTGPPKAIQYSHRQLVLACRAIAQAFPQIGAEDRVLCWLPMAHLFQRMMNLVAITRGARIYFVEDPRQVMEAIREVQPSVFVAVPRFYERLHEGIAQRLGGLLRPVRRLAGAALRAGAIRAGYERSCRRPPLLARLAHALAEPAVLRRLRRVMGGKIKFMITGSAPTAPWLLEFFHGLGLLVLEAYGVSENTVPMAANRPESYRFGSVGRPFVANEIRLAEDGEILLRGPGVFGGYYREDRGDQADRGAAPFTPEGFYRTGDLGRFDADGFLYLTGRKSELIKTSTGRRISPAQVEAVYARSPLIDQVIVVGNARKYLVGLVVPRPGAIARELAARGNTPPSTGGEMASSPEVRELIARQIESLGGELAPYERILNFAVLPEPLSLQRGEITPTLKIRRDRVSASYADVIEKLYEEPPICGEASH